MPNVAMATPVRFEWSCHKLTEERSHQLSIKLTLDPKAGRCQATGVQAYAVWFAPYTYDFEFGCHFRSVGKTTSKGVFYDVTLPLQKSSARLNGHGDHHERIRSFRLIINSDSRLATGVGKDGHGKTIHFQCRPSKS